MQHVLDVLLHLKSKSHQGKRVRFFSDNIDKRHNFILMADTDGNIWRDAFEKNFSEQTLINNVVKEIANSISRNIGWMTLEYILYGGENVLT